MKHSEIYRVTAQLSGHVAGNCWAKANEPHGLSFLGSFLISSFLFLTLQTGIWLPQQLQSQTETQLVSSFKYLFLLCC